MTEEGLTNGGGDPAVAARSGADMFAGVQGSVARDLAGVDWDSTPLGAPDRWPMSLRTVVAVMLSSRFSMWMAWGADLTFFCNDTYRRDTLGRKYPWALGRPAREVWSEIWEDLGPRIERVLSRGEATWDEALQLFLERSGFTEETYHTFSYSPLRDDEGAVAGMLCVVSEDTARVISERRMATLRDLGAEPAASRSEEDVLTLVARCLESNRQDFPFALLYSLDDSTSRAILEAASGAAIGDEIAPALADSADPLAPWPVAEAAAGGMVVVELAGKFGNIPCGVWSDPPSQAVIVPFLAPTGAKPYGFLVAGLNPYRPWDFPYRSFLELVAAQIASGLASARAYEQERHRAEVLVELDQAKTSFLTNVSHEFRTPLTLMLGPLEEAIASPRVDGDLSGQLAIVRRNAERLLRLVNSLLDFARLEAGQTEAQLVITDVGARTVEIASSFTEVCRRAGIDLVLDCREAYAAIDLDMWETVLLNLLSNAFKFTFTGSITVSVFALEAGGGVQAIVADTGIGIASVDLERVFDRFYRPADHGGRSVEGSGIGLALVRSLVEIQGGSITLDSTAGVGTAVTIDLPTAGEGVGRGGDDQGRSVKTDRSSSYISEALQWIGGDAEPESSGSEGIGRPVVLVADDNADMRQQLRRILGSRYEVVLASDGSQALEHIRHEPPDLVVTDVMMPTLDGLGLVAALRADPELESLPVVMLSARAGVQAASEGLAAGVDDYIVKPFTSRDLLARVDAKLVSTLRIRARQTEQHSATLRAEALSRFGTALAAAASIPAVLDALLAFPEGRLGAQGAAVGLIEGEDGLIRVTYAGEVDPLLTDRYHLVNPDAPVPVAEAIRSGRMVVINDGAEEDRHLAETAATSSTADASVAIPLRSATGVVTGAMSLMWSTPITFTDTDLDRLQVAADMVSRAADRLSLTEQEHRLVSDLQNRLLTLDVRSTSVAVAGCYEPAGELLHLGGDWYTATALDEHRVAMSVGDVVGHGLGAIATMSQIRSAIGGAGQIDSKPAAVMDAVNRYAETVAGAATATLAYAILDTEQGAVEYACAGHPYPLLVLPDGSTRFLEHNRQPPLGGPWTPLPPAVRDVAPVGSVIILYSDGLVERRRESLDVGFERLVRAATAAIHQPVGEICDHLRRQLRPPGGYTDDVVVLVARPAGVTQDSFVEVIPARYAAIAPMRARLWSWLEQISPGAAANLDVLLSVCEAINNAIEHGSRADPTQRVAIEVFHDPGQITATVSDRGKWTGDSAASWRQTSRGRGLALMHALSDRVTTVRDLSGTRVTLTHYRSMPAKRRPQ